MICEVCGKSNINGLTECRYCGAKMPALSGANGFADILSINPSQNDSGNITGSAVNMMAEKKRTEGISDADMQRLIKKSDNIIRNTKANSVVGVIAVILSVIIFVSSVVTCMITISAVNGYKDETMKQLAETKKELEKYKAEIDEYINQDEKAKKDAGEDKDAKKDSGKDEELPAAAENEVRAQ